MDREVENKPLKEAGKYQEVPLGTEVFKKTALIGVSVRLRTHIAGNG